MESGRLWSLTLRFRRVPAGAKPKPSAGSCGAAGGPGCRTRLPSPPLSLHTLTQGAPLALGPLTPRAVSGLWNTQEGSEIPMDWGQRHYVKEMLLSIEHLLWRKSRRLQAITCFVQKALVYIRNTLPATNCLCMGSDRGQRKGCFGTIQAQSPRCPAQCMDDTERAGHCIHGRKVGSDLHPLAEMCPCLSLAAASTLRPQGWCCGIQMGEHLGTRKRHTGLGLIGGSLASSPIESLPLELLWNHLHKQEPDRACLSGASWQRVPVPPLADCVRSPSQPCCGR